MKLDLETVEKTLEAVKRETDPVKWSSLMNIKGMLLRNKGDFKGAESAFISALYVDDAVLKCKILINYATTEFLKKDMVRAIQVIDRFFELAKANKKLQLNLFLGYAHLLKGEITYHRGDEKAALSEFKKAEFFFEGTTDARGVGLSCLEIARIHIKGRNLTTAWNFLRRAEVFLSRLGNEEKLGIAVCKGIALYYSDKADEAMALMDAAYREAGIDRGAYRYVMDEVLDVYLDTGWRMLNSQQSLM
ncbi:MAG: hypothetical protein Q8J64_03220 [Thermodesulfovibrionales bacterium]|nr:hypothetical protein [Thermodesulfovibrionales bacterium]